MALSVCQSHMQRGPDNQIFGVTFSPPYDALCGEHKVL